jgi:hypothetical protein
VLERGGPPTAFAGVEWPGLLVPTFRRGFVEELTIREEDWERAMEGACREHPLRDLTLDVGPLPTDTSAAIRVDVPLPTAHVLDRIALQGSGWPLLVFDPAQPDRFLTERRGPFTGRRLALIAAVQHPTGPYQMR